MQNRVSSVVAPHSWLSCVCPRFSVSYVTLFELTVVNNWFVIMYGHVDVTNSGSYSYFMIYFMLAVVVSCNVIVAFILDA